MMRALIGLGACVTLGLAPPVGADDFVDRANAFYASIPGAKRSDLILLPALAKMDATPSGIDGWGGGQRGSLLLARPGMSGWAPLEGWLTAAPQREALDAMRRVVGASPALVFAQPYGTDGVSIDLIRAGAYTDLGDPPTIVGATYGTLERLEALATLALLETARLEAEGKPFEAIELTLDFLLLSRQIADRELFKEATFGHQGIIAAMTRIRDIAYEDFRSDDRKLTSAQILSILERLKPERLALERLGFPDADKIGGEQLIAQSFDASGQPSAGFATRMALLAARDFPLRLFAETAAWDRIADSHKDLIDTRQANSRACGDWEARWALNPFDQRMREPFYFERVRSDPTLRIVTVGVPDMGMLFQTRRVIATETVGTRTSLGVLAYYYDLNTFPPLLASVRPRYLPEIEADPFNPDREFGRLPPLKYFVPHGPGYRTLDPRETPQPHVMDIVTQLQNFRARVDRDEFVIYSTGTDGAASWVDRVENTYQYSPNSDYLIWPPVYSLLRRHLVETGALK